MTKKSLLGGLAAAALAVAFQANAQTQQPSGSQGSMTTRQKNLQTAMAQAQAIAPLFSNPVAWRGDIPAGVLGQGAPAAVSQGAANCSPIVQGWYSCDVTERYSYPTLGTGGTGIGEMGQGGTGAATMPSQVTSWAGHLVVGYDANANTYKATMVDNQGTGMTTLDGTLAGKKFTLTSTAPVMMMGQPQKQRLTFEYTDPNNIQFTDERQPSGQQGWTLFEKATIRPYTSAMSRQASTPTRR